MHVLSKTLDKLTKSQADLEHCISSHNTRETYRDQGGVGAGWLVSVAGEGSCDACLELRCTKDHFQCLVSMMTLKC